MDNDKFDLDHEATSVRLLLATGVVLLLALVTASAGFAATHHDHHHHHNVRSFEVTDDQSNFGSGHSPAITLQEIAEPDSSGQFELSFNSDGPCDVCVPLSRDASGIRRELDHQLRSVPNFESLIALSRIRLPFQIRIAFADEYPHFYARDPDSGWRHHLAHVSRRLRN